MKKRRKAERGRTRKRSGAQPRSAATTPEGKALQESEAKFRSLVENTAAPIGIIDLTGDFTYVNKALADLGGYTVQELVGRPFMDFLHPEDREAVLSTFMKGASTSEEAPEIEFRVKRRDGKMLTLTSKPTRLQISGNTVGFQAIITDITERERMQRELKQSEERYRLIAENMTETIWLMDMNLKPTYISPSAVPLRGYTLEELYALPIDRQLTPDSLKLAWETFKEALSEENLNSKDAPTSVTLQLEFYRKDGSTFWNESTFSLVRNSKGEPAGILGVGREITERKRMEEELRLSEERYRSLVENSKDSIVILDLKGNVVFGNKASEELTGYSVEEGVGMNVRDITPLRYWPRSLEMLLKARTGKPISYFESLIKRKDGQLVPVESGGQAILQDGKVVGIQIITRDITERKRMEEEIRSLAQFPSENPNPILRLDRHGTVLSANEACKPLLQEWGSGIGEVAPKSWRDLITDALSTEESRNIDVEFGGKAYTFLVKPVMEAEYVNLYGRDITERKRAEEALRRWAEELAALQATVLDITSRHDLAVLLETIVERAARLLRVSSGGMYLCDPHKREARCVVAYRTPYDIKGTVLKYGEGAAGTVAETGKPLLIDDYRTWEGRAVAYEETKPFVAVLGVPVIWQGEVTGVIDVLDDRPQHFTKADQELLTLFANHAAIAVENARLLEQEKRHAEELTRYSTNLEQLVSERTKKLAESEKRFRDLSDLLPQIVYEVDERGNFTFLNHIAFAYTGYTQADVDRGLNALQMFVPDDRHRIEQTIRRGLSGDKLGVNEYTALRKDGTTFPVIIHSAPIMDEGKAVGLRGIAMDITDRKRAEEEIRAARERLEYVISSNPAVIFTGKPHSDLADFDNTYMSGSVTALLGYKPRDFVDDPEFWSKHVHPEDRPRVRAAMPRLFKDGHLGVDYRFMHKDGGYRWVHEEVRAVRDAEGSPLEVIGYWTDITERRRMDEELRAARERLEYAVASNPAVIYSGKPLADYSDWHLTYISESVVAMLGFEPRDFVGHPEFWDRHVPPEDVRYLRAEIPLLWKKGQHAFEFRFLHRDGTYRWIREEARVVRYADGKPIEVSGYWTDVSERKRLEEELVKSQRLAAIGELAAMVGHDLRNPLQGIVSTVYLAKRKLESLLEPSREPAEKPGLVDMLETIENEAEYMDKIVSDLQDYAAPLKTEPEPVEMEPLVKDVLSKIRIPRNVKVSFKVSEPLPSVMIDPVVMRRVFTNLIMNAIQAMPDGGELEIDMYGTDESLFVAFKDTGMGIPEENMGKLFNPLFTTKAKGQGLGLPVCKRLVEGHNGRITVESKLGEGSMFTVKLPIIKP